MKIFSLIILISIAFCANVRGAVYLVMKAADIAKLGPKLRPGDHLVMGNGEWKNQIIRFRASGTLEKPITLRAQSPGKVILTGHSSLEVNGNHLIIDGLFFNANETEQTGVHIEGFHNRLTETAVIGGTHKFFVQLLGREHRVDHCYLAGKTSESATLQVTVEGTPNHHQIDHNYFGPRAPLGKNGGETIRVGLGAQSMLKSATLVELNLFEQCNGEIEVISNKSNNNIYRSNTFMECAGMLTLRQGKHCRVEGNYFFGNHKKGTGGIRVIDSDHTIVNNYIEGVDRGGIWVTAGEPNGGPGGYAQPRNCVIAFNTIVDSDGPCLDLSAGFGTNDRSVLPENITIANNFFIVPAGGRLLAGTEGKGFKWGGNLVSSSRTLDPHTGITAREIGLERSTDGVLRPASGSTALGAADPSLATVKLDIDGQLRTRPFDIGCDQHSNKPVLNHPLTPAAVGPAWRGRKTAE